MNDEFIRLALRHGEAGKKWLDSIPEILKACEQEWNITVAEPFHLNYNYVAPAVKEDGTKVVLKIGFPTDREFQSEIEALQICHGEGLEKIFEVDVEHCAILLEQVLPGVPLSTMEDDSEATRIIARVMKKIHKPLPEKNSLIPLTQWIRELPQYLQKYTKDTSPLPWELVIKANDLFTQLLATSQDAVLVHGDLHHDNILSSDREEWLAIDPKGIAAEPAYEVAAMIRNPYEKLKDIENLEPLLRNRIMILAEELSLDPQRIHQWCFAQTVLSAVWNDNNPKGSEHTIRIAKALDTLKI